jgi:hypothetical protein
LKFRNALVLLVALVAADPLRAQAGTGGYLALHTAFPMSTLNSDVDGKLGFGFSAGIHQPLTSRFAVRGSFSWTGYRVDDRNLWWKAFASVFDVSYSEERLVLRSYALGAELLGYFEDDQRGAYILGGGGLQRSRLYLEHVSKDGDNNETSSNLATWPAADTPYFCVGLGYQGQEQAFIEGKFQFWRYHAVKGYRLLDTPLDGRPSLRDAAGLTLAVGFRF